VKCVATPFAALPPALHFVGEPNDWVRMTRPGQRLHSFLEGPCFDPDGGLWIADVPYGRLFRIQDGVWTVEHADEGEPHGLVWSGRGPVIADYRRGLRTPDGTSLAAGWNGENFRGLSDLAIAPDGSIWFTDPGRSSLADPTGRLFRLADGKVSLVLGNIPYPNGVAISPDGRFVYVAVTRANAVWRLAADVSGAQPPMTGVFLNLSGGLGPDGIAVDRRGRIAIAQAQAGRAHLFDPLGDLLATIHVSGGLWTTACAFGPDDALYIVEAQAGAIHRIAAGDLP
jgi:gluconolactonase